MNTAGAPAWVPPILVPFVTLSYPAITPKNPDSFRDSSYYETGYLDLCLIISLIAVMAVVRDVTRLYVLEPFARLCLSRTLKSKKQTQFLQDAKANGLNTNGTASGHSVGTDRGYHRMTKKEERQLNRSVVRFAEQGWAFIYYTIQCAVGFYVHYQLPTKMFYPSEAVWANYPNIPLPTPIKFYYLNETAFYLHGIFILNAEARRKDHWQMMTHHFIAVALMFLSYNLNVTRVGCLIMVLMDCCDVLLPLAKMLRYLGANVACDTTFAMFMVTWIVTRHILFIRIIHSTIYDLAKSIPPRWEPEIGYYFTRNVHLAFNVLLVSLQILQLAWLTMIFKVLYKVLTGQGAQDVRTDDETGEEDDKKNE